MIIGLGGLGCVIAPYLAAAGVGRLSLVDFDEVSLSNLQRQPLYSEIDIGRPKVIVARERLLGLNSGLQITPFALPLEELPAEALDAVDLLVDATDRLATRDLICELSHDTGAAHVYGSVSGFEGQVGLLRPEESCYRCLFPELPRPGLIQSCAQVGVVGAGPAMIGAAQALLCLRALIGIPLEGPELLTSFDLLSLSSFQVPLARHERCPHHRDTAAQPKSERSVPISARGLLARRREGWRPIIIDVRERAELEAGLVEGALSWPLSELEALLSQREAQLEPRAGATQPAGAGELSIVLYCARGPRAERAARLMLNEGVTERLLEQLSALQPPEVAAPALDATGASLRCTGASLRCWELVGGWHAWLQERAEA